ncbi:MAG: YbjN domain-containing protein [Alphaproteobacteria bacterium]|nr:YbjN domain-containing protein [Alphaproteobacteria bacterium]
MTNAQPLNPDIETIADTIRSFGISVEIVELDSGTKGLHASTSGIPFSAFLFRNDQQKSPYVMMSAMFPEGKASLEWVNHWNNRFPLTRASIAAGGEPMLTHSIILTGVAPEHLRETLSWWDLLLRNFVEQLNSEK